VLIYTHTYSAAHSTFLQHVRCSLTFEPFSQVQLQLILLPGAGPANSSERLCFITSSLSTACRDFSNARNFAARPSSDSAMYAPWVVPGVLPGAASIHSRGKTPYTETYVVHAAAGSEDGAQSSGLIPVPRLAETDEHTHTHTNARAHTPTHTHIHTHTHTYTHTYTHTTTCTHKYTLSLSLSLTRARTHAHAHTHANCFHFLSMVLNSTSHLAGLHVRAYACVCVCVCVCVSVSWCVP